VALLLRSLVALRLAVCHWRRRSKRCMHDKAAQHWQQRRCRRVVLLWHWWAAARRHADMAQLRSSWRRWRSGILARALLTRVFSAMERCWAARRHQRELRWAALAAGVGPPAAAAAAGRCGSRERACSKGYAQQCRVLAVSFAGWRLWLRACLAKRQDSARMEMASSYRATTLLLQGLRWACMSGPQVGVHVRWACMSGPQVGVHVRASGGRACQGLRWACMCG
jgi:hypothetical protein